MTVAEATQVKHTTVLVIEDDQEINELLGEYLTLEQIGYVSALTGEAGLQRAASAHPDAVILDLMLPDIDGYEIARQLSTHRATYAIPLVMLTCMNQDCDRHKGFASGALHYMNKPFLPDDLLAVLKQALDWRSALATRPPQGTITVSTADHVAMLRQLNNMIADLFTCTQLPDAVIAHIREAFEHLAAWAIEWGEKNKQDPSLSISYRILTATGDLAGGAAAPAAIEWTLSETTPALLAAAFFKPAAPTPSGPASSVLALTQRVFGGKSSVNGTPPDGDITPSPAGTAANWYAFLGKTGASQFDKDSATHSVRITRSLTGEPTVPVLSADGARTFPHRLHDEAVAAKRK